MKHFLKLYSIAAILLFGSFLALAQTSGYQFSQLNINNGLSHNEVTCIFKDRTGFMWFGTMSGLNRYDGYTVRVFRRNVHDSTSINDDYIESIQQGFDDRLWIRTRAGMTIYDPATETFTHNTLHYFRSAGIDDDNIKDVKADHHRNLWILSSTSGLYRYRPGAKTAEKVRHLPLNSRSILPSPVSAMANNGKSNLWILHNSGEVEELNPLTLRCSSRFMADKLAGNAPADLKLFVDDQSDLWIYNATEPQGAYYIRSGSTSARRFSASGGRDGLNSNLVNGITQDSKGLVWIATDHGGINIVDKRTFLVRQLLSVDDDNKSIAQNCINTLYKDDNGIIWAGTFKKGISYYHENIIQFPLVKKRPLNKSSLPYEDVNQFAEDDLGNIWIGTNGGGLIYYNRRQNTFKQYFHDAEDPNSLSNNVIVSLFIDHHKALWVGTYYGGLDRLNGDRFIHYKNNLADESSISDDRVWSIFEDSGRRLWVGTLNGGLNLFDRSTNRFAHFTRSMPNSLNSGYVSSLVEARNGNIWIGTSDGINIYNPQNRTFRYLTYRAQQGKGLTNNNISTILRADNGMMLVGTREGLNVYNGTGTWLGSINDSDGLPANAIVSILEDKQGVIWVGTPKGLAKISMLSAGYNGLRYKIQTYDENDGLQGKAFNERSCLRLRSGELIFGGANGFNIFDPGGIRSVENRSPLIFTQLDVLNRPVEIGQKIDGNIILRRSVSNSSDITLRYDQNVISLGFAALNYVQPDKVNYSYKLEGFDKNWITVGSRERKATYTNLDPGDYVFTVKSIANNGAASSEKSLHITVLPPLWRTYWAYCCYVLLVGCIFYIARRQGIARIRRKFQLEQERREARRIHELDIMKIKFFTNLSHEFRTPISLILAPLENLKKQAPGMEFHRQLQMISRNADRLLHMVNQLLDFRKLEMSEHRLQVRPGNIIPFIREITGSFTDIAEKKNIAYVFRSDTTSLEADFDHDKIERILFNLIANAFKFTLSGGAVTVTLTYNYETEKRGFLKIAIRDTGIGMESHKLEAIFQQFYQIDLPASIINQGTGIGLAITREFVALHGGRIEVESEPEKGSEFRVFIPLSPCNISNIPEEVCYRASRAQVNAGMNMPLIKSADYGTQRLKVLLIDDNDDLLYYLKDNLQHYFQIETAGNGREGWQKILARHPDLVVSDIMMPEMDGIQLCEKLKKDERTAHIPVILLTAQIAEEQMLAGLDIGANDYITKPFNFQVLIARVRSLLKHQDSVRKTYRKQLDVSPAKPVNTDPDARLMQQVMDIVEKNMSNSAFTIEELSAAVNMSRVSFYKKIIALSGLAPLDFVRSIRLKKAALLLQQKQLTVSEIAYEVGFSTPKYFARLFKAEYGVLPSAYAGMHTEVPIADS